MFLSKPPIIRPPAEADSLILQVSYGCAHNRCAFCVSFRERPFQARPFEDIAAEIDAFAHLYRGTRKVFLGDGDPLTLPTESLLPVLDRIREKMPTVRRISAYAAPKNFRDKSPADLKRLSDAGLTQVYIGFESGDDEVLRRIRKDTTHGEMVEFCTAIHAAGIKISAIVILGLGGPTLSRQHAENSAKLINETKPRFASSLTLICANGSEDYAKKTGIPDFRELTPKEILKESRILVEGITANGIIFRSNHVSNVLALEGTFQKSKARMLEEIDEALARPSGFRSRRIEMF